MSEGNWSVVLLALLSIVVAVRLIVYIVPTINQWRRKRRLSKNSLPVLPLQIALESLNSGSLNEYVPAHDSSGHDYTWLVSGLLPQTSEERSQLGEHRLTSFRLWCGYDPVAWERGDIYVKQFFHQLVIEASGYQTWEILLLDRAVCLVRHRHPDADPFSLYFTASNSRIASDDETDIVRKIIHRIQDLQQKAEPLSA